MPVIEDWLALQLTYVHKKILAFWRRPHSFHEAESSGWFLSVWSFSSFLVWISSFICRILIVLLRGGLSSYESSLYWLWIVRLLSIIPLTRSLQRLQFGKPASLDKDLYSFWDRQLLDPLPMLIVHGFFEPFSAVKGAYHIPFCPPNCSKSLWRTQVHVQVRDHKRLIFVSDIEPVWFRLIGCMPSLCWPERLLDKDGILRLFFLR